MPFGKDQIRNLRRDTPFFVFSKEVLLANLKEYQTALPQDTEICFAMKSNSEKIVLEALNEAGASFEVASKYELDLLKKIKVPPERIVYGTAVKPESHIKEFVEYGVDRFAFDSQQELEKIAMLSPGSRVFVRVLVDDGSNSVFTMSEKFGAPLEAGPQFLRKAKELGLVPYGISFNVGSQARNVHAWARGIRDVGHAMQELLKDDIKIQVVNIGGGFPHSYQKGDDFPSIHEIAGHINQATNDLPYGVNFIAEPGRGLVANAFVLVTSVIASNKRSNGHWLFLDVGVYNGLLEAMARQGSTDYELEPLSNAHPTSTKEPYIVTGPTGDNLDVINQEKILPVDIEVGEKFLIRDVGAYTFPLMTHFNGFPKPSIIELIKDQR